MPEGPELTRTPGLGPARRKLKVWRLLLSLLVVGLAFLFMGRSLYKNWRQVSQYFTTLHFKWALLPIPFLLYAFSFLIMAYAWKEVLVVMGEKIRLGRASWVVIYSQFGKYLPGKVWAVMGRVYLAREDGIEERHSAVSVIIETVYLFLTSLVLFAVSLLFYESLPAKAYWLLAFIPVVLVWVYPPWFNRMVNFLLKRLSQKPVAFNPTLGQACKLMLIYAACWIVQGLGLYVLTLSFYPLPLRTLPIFPGAYSVSWILGILVLIAPGGLGVREGVFALLLNPVIPGALNVVASLLSRIWITVSELLLLGSIFLIQRLLNHREHREHGEPGVSDSDSSVTSVSSVVGDSEADRRKDGKEPGNR